MNAGPLVPETTASTMPSFVETVIRRMTPMRRYNLRRRLDERVVEYEERRDEASMARTGRMIGRLEAIHHTHVPLI